MMVIPLSNQLSQERFYRPVTTIRPVAVFMGATNPADGIEITAHRGASYLAPENTLAAIKLAWESGADSVEIDIYQTKDGQIVAIHDEDTKRTAGVKLPVADTSLARLRKLDVGRWKAAKYAGERIPTLAEVLATIPDGKRLLIEIKCGKEVVPALKRAIAAAGKRPQQTALIAFDAQVLFAAKQALPELHTQWVMGTIPERDKLTRRVRVSLADVIASCRSAKFSGLSVRRDSEIDAKFVKQIHDAGLELHVWTVNSPDEAKRFMNLGVDAITTDRPGYLRRKLNGK